MPPPSPSFHLNRTAVITFAILGIVLALCCGAIAGAASAFATIAVDPTTTVVAPLKPVTTAAPSTTAGVPTAKAVVTTTSARPVSTPPPTKAATVTTPTVTSKPVPVTVPPTSEAPKSSTPPSSDVLTPSTLASALLVAGPNDTTPNASGSADPKISPATKLRGIIGALIALALIVLFLTIAYARHTRPEDWEDWEDEDGWPDTDAKAVASSAPSVPNLLAPVVASAVVAPAVAGSSGPGPDEPTLAFQPPEMIKPAGVVIAPASLPLVTLEDLQREVADDEKPDDKPDAGDSGTESDEGTKSVE